MSAYILHHGDCMALLRAVAGNSMDAILTAPRHHLMADKKGGSGPASVILNELSGRSHITTGFMDMQLSGGDIAHRMELCAEALRVLKPGSYLLNVCNKATVCYRHDIVPKNSTKK